MAMSILKKNEDSIAAKTFFRYYLGEWNNDRN